MIDPMCHSYQDGFCLYYDVPIDSLTHRTTHGCTRGDCMDLFKQQNVSLVTANDINARYCVNLGRTLVKDVKRTANKQARRKLKRLAQKEFNYWRNLNEDE